MEDEIKTMLSHGQQNIFWSFVPCIVPEVDFENPVRTGQAAASSRLMPACELIRTTSEEMWKKHGQAYLDHILKVIEQDAGKMTEETREDLRRRLVKHAWRIEGECRKNARGWLCGFPRLTDSVSGFPASSCWRGQNRQREWSFRQP